jgi:lipoprotein signal peptidase
LSAHPETDRFVPTVSQVTAHVPSLYIIVEFGAVFSHCNATSSATVITALVLDIFIKGYIIFIKENAQKRYSAYLL